jgi:hypothetical protein
MERRKTMKRLLLSATLCALFIFTSSGVASGADPPTDPGGLFLVDIDGERVVLQFFGSEHAWQYLPDTDPRWYPGLAPHPFEFKIWYPDLSDTFDMDLDQQLAWIEDLDYAGVDDWRIGYFWDAVPLKASIFQGMNPGMNNRFNWNSDVYFMHTSEVSWGPQTLYQTHGRTGNEWGDPATGGNGAIIEAGGGFPDPEWPPGDGMYTTTGVPVPGAPPNSYYTLLPTHGQDHYWQMGPTFHMYDDDINCSPDWLPYAIQMGNVPMGAWTVSESIPELWPPNHKFHEITISAAINPAGDLPAGTLVPVEIVGVYQDEEVDSEGSGNTAPDAIVDCTDEAAVVQVRAERDGEGNGRVYHIQFTYGEGTHTFYVGVPNNQGKNTVLVDDGALYDSTVE